MIVQESTETKFPKLEELFPLRGRSAGKDVVDFKAVRKHIRDVNLITQEPTSREGLPDLSGPPEGNDPLPEPDGYVDRGSLYSFAQNLNASDASAVLDSVLFAQAVADLEHENKKNTQEWYDEYVHWLSVQGWVTQNFSWKDLNDSTSELVMQDAILEVIISAVGSGAVYNLMLSLFQILVNKQDTPEFTLLENKKNAKSGGGFQIGAADYSGGGAEQVVCPSMFTAYQTEETHHNFLWWSWTSSSINFYGAFNNLVLNKDAWNQVKDEVIEKLGELRTQQIGSVGPLKA